MPSPESVRNRKLASLVRSTRAKRVSPPLLFHPREPGSFNVDAMDPDFQAWYKEAKSLEKRFVEAIHHLRP